MTWTMVDDGPDRDPIPAPRAAYAARIRRALLGALLGALALGLVAWLLSRQLESSVGASALVTTHPDPASVESPDGDGIGGDAAIRNATWVETELVRVRGGDFAGRLAESLDLPSVDVTAEQVGESNVIEIAATGSTAAEAQRQAQAAADLYIADRRQRLVDRITEQSAAVDGQIVAVDTALRALGPPPDEGFDLQNRQRDALSERYADQLAARDSLQRASADVAQVASLVQSATPTPPGVVSSSVLVVLLAVVAGGLLGAAGPSILRSVSGRIQDEADLADVNAPVLTPALPGRVIEPYRSRLPRAMQLQALRMANGPASGGSLAVLGPTPGVGTTFTAVEHARHAARRHRTLLVVAAREGDTSLTSLGLDPIRRPAVGLVPAGGGPVTAEVLGGVAQPTRVPTLSVLDTGDATELERALSAGLVRAAADAGWAVVVDTAPLDRSNSGLEAARQCQETVLVAGIGRSTLEDVERSLAAVHAAGATVTGIIVARPQRRAATSRWWPQLSGARSQAAHHEQVQGA